MGVTTVIQSTSSPDIEDEQMGRSGKVKRSGSKKVLRKNVSETHLRDDSSEEFLPVQKPGGDWGVRKTTEVRTSEEVHRAKAGRSGPPRL